MTTTDNTSPDAPAEPVPAFEETSGQLGGVDLEELTERVYRRWVDELRRERERSGVQWW